MKKKKKNNPKVYAKLHGLDKTIELKKVVEINLSNVDSEFIYFEKMKSGD